MLFSEHSKKIAEISENTIKLWSVNKNTSRRHDGPTHISSIKLIYIIVNKAVFRLYFALKTLLAKLVSANSHVYVKVYLNCTGKRAVEK